ncbi:LacI family DNA-binding transcriptional regulator [Jiella pacifica]|uniref:Substrate-binding domain-containing protein n=1 Tax=Jiella pacifica TaxID=2696469 RepID=A0A6N9TDK3_9HYPH|nr:LacI family DNA-binding transcriptional regulator [Jiella pacifica]NDW06948.1 substrate-binding domain-containing protein [Jiella pacifica]
MNHPDKFGLGLRPTIHDVAHAARVSLATVDRVLNGRNGVRPATRERVLAAVKAVGYERDVAAANLSKRREYRIHFVLPAGPNSFMRGIEDEVASLCGPARQDRVQLSLQTVPPFDAPGLVTALHAIDPKRVDGLAVVATDAPIVREAIDGLVARGLPVVTLVSDVPSSRRGHFVGIDNVTAGRTAAGLLGRFCHDRPGDLAVVAGSGLVRDHVERRLGFEQVIRTEYRQLKVLPSIEGLDEPDLVDELLSDLLAQNPSIVGIYSLGAGTRGVSRALTRAGLARRPWTVVHELTPHARQELRSGVFDAVLHQDIGHEVRSAIRVLRARIDGRPFVPAQERIRIEVFLRDNIP